MHFVLVVHVLHGTKLVGRKDGVPVLSEQTLGGDTVGVVAHEHVGEVRTIVHPLTLGRCCPVLNGRYCRGGFRVALAVFLEGLHDGPKVWLMEVRDRVTLTVVQADLVRGRLEEGVGEVLHHVAWFDQPGQQHKILPMACLHERQE